MITMGFCFYLTLFQTWLLPLSERLSLDAQDHNISTFLEAIKLVQLQETFSIDKKIGELIIHVPWRI